MYMYCSSHFSKIWQVFVFCFLRVPVALNKQDIQMNSYFYKYKMYILCLVVRSALHLQSTNNTCFNLLGGIRKISILWLQKKKKKKK